MTFTVLQNGVDALDADVMMENLGNIVYAILWNRMEQDKSGMTQLTPNMQSDIFTDTNGCYNTICTACTTSTFITNSYYPLVNCTTPAYILDCCCIVGCGGINTCLSNNVYAYSRCTSNASACYKHHYSMPLTGVYKINMIANVCGYMYDTYSSYLSNIVVNSDVTCVCWHLSGSGSLCCCCCTNCYCFERNGGNYNLYKNGTCICQYTSNCTMDICFDIYTRNQCANNDGALGCANLAINIYTMATCTVIYNNLKTYSTLKSAFIYETNSTLPSGNCVRAKVYNQNGNIYLDNAIPGCLYNLSANDSCCFRVELWQCVACNLCAPQCMTQYSLIFM